MYYWATRHMKEQEVAQFEFQLEMPLSPSDDGIGSTGTDDESFEKAMAGMMM